MTNALTLNEKQVLLFVFIPVNWCYEERENDDWCGYYGEGVDVKKLSKDFGKPVNWIKGVLGSLCAKGTMTIHGEGENCSVYFNIKTLKENDLLII